MNVGDELRKLGKELGPLSYPEDRAGTHWEDCYRTHHNCAIQKVDRLRARLSEAERLLKKASKHLLSSEGATEILEFLEDGR